MSPSTKNQSLSKTTLHSIHPSPQNPTQATLPPPLRETLTTLLVTNASSIPAIQAALADALNTTGWTPRLSEYVLEVARAEPGIGERELLERVVGVVRAGVDDGDNGGVKGKGKGKGREEEVARLPPVPREAVGRGVEAVRRELEALCEVAEDQD